MSEYSHKEMLRKAPSIVDGFNQFARNGRWGTCVSCPMTSDNKAIPEACENTDRYDHQLTLEQLSGAYTQHATISVEEA